jgi:hypothetical protein
LQFMSLRESHAVWIDKWSQTCEGWEEAPRVQNLAGWMQTLTSTWDNGLGIRAYAHFLGSNSTGLIHWTSVRGGSLARQARHLPFP